MRYKYVVAYQLVGIAKPEAEEKYSIDLGDSGVRAWIDSDLSALPNVVDESVAIGNILLLGLVGQGGGGDIGDQLVAEVDALRQRRQQETGAACFLIVQVDGDISEFDPNPKREFDNYILAIDSSPKNIIRNQHEAILRGLLAAISLEFESLCEIKKIIDSVTFLREDGKPLYCYEITGGGKGYAVTPLVPEALKAIPQNSKKLSRQQGVLDAARLLTKSYAEACDPLLAFLSAWCGLEIFVNKNFKDYERDLLGKLSNGGSSVLPMRIVERIRIVMADKYRLSDKFALISGELSLDETQADQVVFESIKIVRDKLLHGEDIAVSSLPAVEAQGLLRKYLLLHLRSGK